MKVDSLNIIEQNIVSAINMHRPVRELLLCKTIADYKTFFKELKDQLQHEEVLINRIGKKAYNLVKLLPDEQTV